MNNDLLDMERTALEKELFRQAAENYPLYTGKGSWALMSDRLRCGNTQKKANAAEKMLGAIRLFLTKSRK